LSSSKKVCLAMLKLLRIVKVLSLFLLIAGCAETGVRPGSQGPGPCCDSLKNLPVVKIQPQKLVTSKLSEASATFNFETGRAKAIAVELVDSRRDRVVQIQSVRTGLGSTPEALCPTITFLDKGHQIIGTIEKRFEYQPMHDSDTTDLRLSIKFAVPEAASLLVIHPEQKLIGNTVWLSWPGAAKPSVYADQRFEPATRTTVTGQVGGKLYYGVGERMTGQYIRCQDVGTFEIILK
jgi:hypothetical protein